MNRRAYLLREMAGGRLTFDTAIDGEGPAFDLLVAELFQLEFDGLVRSVRTVLPERRTTSAYVAASAFLTEKGDAAARASKLGSAAAVASERLS